MKISLKYIALYSIILQSFYITAQTQQQIKNEMVKKLNSFFSYPIKIGTLDAEIFKKWNDFILSINIFMKKNITMDKSLTATWEMIKRANYTIITTIKEWDELAKKDLLSQPIAMQSTKVLEKVNNNLRKIQESSPLTKKYILAGNNKAVNTMKNFILVLLQISNRIQEV